MKRKSIISVVICFIMFMTVFAVMTPEAEAASKKTYWIKVNTRANVVTVYKKSGSKYKPLRAMLCSAGDKGYDTPLGEFTLGSKIGWCYMVGNVWGQYSMGIWGDYLFHTVCSDTKSKDTMIRKEFNKLGTNCSHGCVRLCTMDAKWIWDNCPTGTRVTIYKSKDPGPLGKPKPIKMKKKWKWDPTDPSKKNPNFSMRKPAIYISEDKASTVEYGADYSLLEGVTAKNLNAYQDLTSKVKVRATYKYDLATESFVKADFSTDVPGAYKIRYRVYDKYCGGAGYKTFYVNVAKPKLPENPEDSEDRDVEII